LISIKTRIKKDKRLLSGRDIMDGTKDGELSIKTNHQRLRVRDNTVPNSDSTS
jgi:hypothetical protein